MINTRYLVVVFDNPLRMVVTDQCLTNSSTLQGNTLREVIQDWETPLFYDWLVSDNKAVGIELHETRDNIERYVGEGVGAFHYSSEFPRLLFWPGLVASPLGCEAFGDLRFFEMENSMRVMTISIDDWLPVATADRLVAAISRAEQT